MKSFILLAFMLPTIATTANSTNIVTQGNSTSTVNVETISNGDSTTHVETDVNGNDQTYNSDSNGSVHIENTGNRYSITVSPAANSSSSASQSTPSAKQKEENTTHSLWSRIENFLSKLFHFF